MKWNENKYFNKNQSFYGGISLDYVCNIFFLMFVCLTILNRFAYSDVVVDELQLVGFPHKIEYRWDQVILFRQWVRRAVFLEVMSEIVVLNEHLRCFRESRVEQLGVHESVVVDEIVLECECYGEFKKIWSE